MPRPCDCRVFAGHRDVQAVDGRICHTDKYEDHFHEEGDTGIALSTKATDSKCWCES
jgi:hypothetical protein